MKFAMLSSYTRDGLKLAGSALPAGNFNLGDQIRDNSLDLVYEKMGINHDDIVILKFDDLATYAGETVVLPINNFLVYPYGFSPLPLSHKIIPVYLSFALHDMELAIPDFYRPYQPIGCRDEQTMRVLQSKGIQCYLNGCLSLLYPRCAEVPKGGKVFFVDTPEQLNEYIPEEITRRAVYLSHQIPAGTESGESVGHFAERVCKERMELYKNEAALIVSTRIHCITPCLAMGIPCICVTASPTPVIPGNGTHLANLLPIYSKSQYGNIDWNPEPINIEPLKSVMLQNAMTSIREAFEKQRLRAELTDTFTIKQEYSVTYRADFYLDLFPKKVPYRDAEVFRGICAPESAYEFESEFTGGRGGSKPPFVNLFLLESLEKLAGRSLPQMHLVIFGAGNEGKIILYELTHLPRQFRSVAFVDNNAKLWNTDINGVPVFPVSYLRQANLSETFILLAGAHCDAMAELLESEYQLQERVHFYKSSRIISTNPNDYGYGPVIRVQ